jgi:CyaY protein
MSSESIFSARADAVLAAVGAALDAAGDASDADLDWSLNDGVLTIDCGRDGKLIVNRHVPNREIWVAAKSGGFHFRAAGGAWRDSRGGEARRRTHAPAAGPGRRDHRPGCAAATADGLAQ